MRTIPITAVAALALIGVAASAQTPSSPATPMRPATDATPMAIHREPALNPLKQEDISKIEGTSVYGGDDGKVGHISTVLMNPDTKKIERLVVSAGGVLGV